jgi:hypothetical protein
VIILKLNAMKKTNNLFILSLLLMGCRLTPSSLSSAPASSAISTSLIPIPNADFEPVIAGRTFLIEAITNYQFSTALVGEKDPLPLAINNFPVTEEVVTPYHQPDGTSLQEDETIEWGQTPLSTDTLFNTLIVGETITGASVYDWLQSQKGSDEKWNRVHQEKKVRNLSHAFLQGDYYWFNHSVREELSQIVRYDNHVLYGEGQIDILFQTGVEVTPVFAYQLHADVNTIYEIYDETYPTGFSGAQDYQYRTPRVMDNFKQALTLGPIQEMLNLFHLINQGKLPPRMVLSSPIEQYQFQLHAKRLTQTSVEIALQIYNGSTFSTASETLSLSGTIADNEWVSFEQRYYLWKPMVS